jgi:hypothetical protein
VLCAVAVVAAMGMDRTENLVKLPTSHVEAVGLEKATRVPWD